MAELLKASMATEDWKKLILKTDPKEDWHYLSEGNANIVFTCRKSNTPLAGFVLRLSKQRDFKQQLWPHDLATKWLGKEYIGDIVYPISIPKEFSKTLVETWDKSRPTHRKGQDECETELCEEACLMYNWCQLPMAANVPTKPGKMFTWEIKPKNLFLSSSPFIDDSHIRKLVCEFSRLQWHKHKNKDESICKHCPLNLLFKHNQDKTPKLFLSELLKCVGKQSYLKVFAHVSADSSIPLTTLCEIKDFEHTLENWNVLLEIFSDILQQHLNLFVKLSLLQKLDCYDIEYVHACYRHLHTLQHGALYLSQISLCSEYSSSSLVQSDNKQDDANDEYKQSQTIALEKAYKQLQVLEHKHLSSNSQINSSLSNNACHCSKVESLRNKTVAWNTNVRHTLIQQSVQSNQPSELVDVINQYMVSRVFRDCSVIVTFDSNSFVFYLHSKCSSNTSSFLDTDPKSYCIGVIDLDPKPAQRIKDKWIDVETEILDHYVIKVLGSDSPSNK
ncbi:inositol 1,3,4,5,6-pentakisphosphate 2-kinase [Reticulomyxa filosa]|uniref:Inositol-pentakisphosphate 2-kinase n=1 Tax=Reticulomyxa filosa TaxID=46433 RepID=X6MLH5_RETFI|nr:inositol 1,3,4,5,6-pentakisphosphate 2-kinase [Reticulomyxa filosa]|eukprot:ETO14302.1 inositol 1,3,4,5,6-pentakisphosphate 2-kinase [Reticulomyxa filosa]